MKFRQFLILQKNKKMNQQAYIFPGQASQFPGMGKNLYDTNQKAKALFEQANEILGFRITDIMFTGTDEELKQTNVTQPAVFLHSMAAWNSIENPQPGMVAGHSLGEFSALVANACLSFEDALKLVSLRASAMQKACEANPSTMAAILALDENKVEEICAAIQNETGEIVVPANYNCPGQLVISGSIKGVEMACEKMKTAGAKRALILPVGGGFHSPCMAPAQVELSKAIDATSFNIPICPIYQNVNALPVSDPATIRINLENQLTSAVRWSQTIANMIKDGANHFTETGPGKVLQGLVNKIDRTVTTDGVQG